MSTWPIKELAHVATILRIGINPRDIDGDTKYVGLENIESGGRIINVSTAEAAGIESQKYQFTADHILYGKLRPYLAKIARPNFGGVCSTDILPIEPSPAIDRNYLCHFLSQPSMISKANARATGVNLPRINPAELGKFTVPVPPIAVQRRIAEVLDHVDALREKRRKSIALLDDLAQSIFLDMFRDPRDGMLRETLTLGDVAEIQGGLQVTLKRKTLPISVPYLRVANVHRGGLDLSEIKQMNVTDRELERTALRKGDLLVVEGHGNPSEIGRVAVWDGSITTCTHQNHLIRVRVDESRMFPEYAESYLNSTVGRRHLLRSAKTTSGLNTISTSTVRSAPVMVPQLPLQEEFRERTRRISSAREKHQASLAHLDTLFSSIQSRAFRGELWQDDLKDL
ncbi:hypothetical protein GV791_13160 [Nocardia cyriacigeorgica]|uniref:Type I restriction modification DNA specificity domain-containing protein n=1 Tax=Nocardia cyriacigeorgica TaxID=135487 RepID=A0A6P1CQ58_9NOCA|nr:restriction endonuclease subunit S [Nocardia cyriacigeorgica]MBF6287251.1 restriction endonuclease subunit S [Nocardia cyriacigeorgica]NEW33504.1 hypothetical protein [Nocardia cyriacigeorgica]BDT86559.1 hypothetical protein FMUAM8_23230 [Nocardia cyriacigeorgica]